MRPTQAERSPFDFPSGTRGTDSGVTYANICETCDTYTAAPQFAPALAGQLADVQALHADAAHRGWSGEAERHQHVAAALQGHLDRLRVR